MAVAPIAAGTLGGLSGAARATGAQALLLYDRDLPAGVRFAAQAQDLGSPARALDGDRIRLVGAWLAEGPRTIFGVTRYADYLLVEDLAREQGFRRSALVQHRRDGALVTQCLDRSEGIPTIAELSGARWPEAFAEFANGGVGRCAHLFQPGKADSAMSWILRRAS